MGKMYKNLDFTYKGGCNMQYDKPIMELLICETEDVVRTSLQVEGGGSGGDYDGDWSN